MLKLFACLICALVMLGACVPPEESNDRVKRYDPEENVMGQIQARGVLRIGIPSDYPPFAIADAAPAEGFVVDMGRLVAEALGVEPEFIPALSDELLDMVYTRERQPLEEETRADLVFPMVPITEELVQSWQMTDPYWVGHTRELEATSSATAMLAAPAPDVELLKFAYEHPGVKITGEELSTEGYGAAVRTGAATFGTLVSQVFNEADAEGDWSRFYEKWLAEYFVDPDPTNVPIMSVEDAAALYPSDLE